MYIVYSASQWFLVRLIWGWQVIARAFKDLEANAGLGKDIFVACHGGVMKYIAWEGTAFTH